MSEDSDDSKRLRTMPVSRDKVSSKEKPRQLTVSMRPKAAPAASRAPVAIAVAAFVLGVIGAAVWRARHPPPSWAPVETPRATAGASAAPEREEPATEEERAIERLAKLARPTIDLAVWSRDGKSEADCALVLPPLTPGQVVTVRPGAGCELIAANGVPVAPDTRTLSSPPLVEGLNWLRVRTSLPRKVLGSIDVPADPPFRREGMNRATPEEIAAYEMARDAIYPPNKLGGSEEAAARAVIDRMPQMQGPTSRRFFHIWLDLAVRLTKAGHGTAAGHVGGDMGASVWEDPEVLAASRRYMDTVQANLQAYPGRWFLWLGLAWQLRWGNAWDAARTAFAQALRVDPTCGWTWFELARWERKMESDGAGDDPRTRSALAHDSLVHYRLAKKHLAAHTGPGLAPMREHIENAILLMDKLSRKAR